MNRNGHAPADDPDSLEHVLSPYLAAGAGAADLHSGEPVPETPRRMVEFRSPSELRAFSPPEGWNIVGDHHIQRGAPFVIGGAPGAGKSRAATYLAVAGAMGKGADWFGLSVHGAFRTIILQAENGPVRLRDEYAEISDPAFDDFIRFCTPPPYGFAFDRPEFCEQLAAAVADFEPAVFIVDPWNRATADDKSKDYLATFERLIGLLPKGDKAPALGIVAHTRKPQAGERSSGRALLNLLAGGYALGSVPRAAFVMQHASDDPEENRVVWTCCKNNDGEAVKAGGEAVRSALADTLAPAGKSLATAAAALPGQVAPIVSGLGGLLSAQGEHFNQLADLVKTTSAQNAETTRKLQLLTDYVYSNA